MRNAETGERIENVRVLLDTGAGISLLPLSAIETLLIEPSGEKINLIGFNESVSESDVYALQVIFSGERLSGDYCATDSEIGVLGRDVLNEFSILFDGVSLEWKKQE